MGHKSSASIFFLLRKLGYEGRMRVQGVTHYICLCFALNTRHCVIHILDIYL